MMLSASRSTQGVARAIRKVTGVPEDHLARVPWEAPRYVAQGIVQISVGLLAVVGMFLLLSLISHQALVLKLLLASCWGVFVIALDAMLVATVDRLYGVAEARASVPPADGEEAPPPPKKPKGRILGRVFFAAAVGLVIAESLIMAAFGTEATNALKDDKEVELRTDICRVETQLQALRPNVVPSEDCPSLLAAAGAGAAGAAAPVAGAEPAASDLTTRLADLEERIARAQELVRCEENPIGFSDERRAELNCSGEEGRAGAYNAAVTQRDDLIAQRNALNTQIAAAASQAVTAAEEARTSGEAKDLAAERRQLRAQLADLRDGKNVFGIGERFDAVEDHVNPWIRWGLRLFFIIADCAPVLLKNSLPTSTVELMTSVESQIVVLGVLSRLQWHEEQFRNGEWHGDPGPGWPPGPDPGGRGTAPFPTTPTTPEPADPDLVRLGAEPMREPRAGDRVMSVEGQRNGWAWQLERVLRSGDEDRPSVFVARAVTLRKGGALGRAPAETAVVKVTHADWGQALAMISQEYLVYDVLGRAPHVAQVIDKQIRQAAGCGSFLFFALPLYTGGDLARLVEGSAPGGEQPPANAIERARLAAAFGRQALSALDAAVRSRILHLDVKGSNFFIEEFVPSRDGLLVPLLRLGDWGLGKQLHDGSSISPTRLEWVSCLTHSPEWVLGGAPTGKVTPMADLYSLAAEMLHILTGDYPYSSELRRSPNDASPSERYRRLLRRVEDGELRYEPPVLGREIDPLVKLCTRWLSVSPQDRQPGSVTQPGPGCTVHEDALRDLQAAMSSLEPTYEEAS